MRTHSLEVRVHTPRRRRSSRNAHNRQKLARHLHGAADVGPGALLAIATSSIIAVIEKGEVRRQDLEAPHWLTRPSKKRRMMECRRAAVARMNDAGLSGVRRAGIEVDDEARAAVEAAAQSIRLKLIEGRSFREMLVNPKLRRYRPTAEESRTFARNVDVLTSTKKRWTVTPRRLAHQQHQGGARHRRASGSAPGRSHGSRRCSSGSAGGGSSGDDGDGDPEPSGPSPWRRLRTNPTSIYVLVRRAGS